jgi:hypothetical protein
MYWLIKAAVSEPESLYKEVLLISRANVAETYLFAEQVASGQVCEAILFYELGALGALA